MTEEDRTCYIKSLEKMVADLRKDVASAKAEQRQKDADLVRQIVHDDMTIWGTEVQYRLLRAANRIESQK